MTTVEEGRWAEDMAERHIVRLGYEVIDRNFYFKKVGEIDIIARKGEMIVFIEVRHRTTARYGSPEASLTPRKCAKLRRCAEAWLSMKKLTRAPCRFDMIAVDTTSGRMEIRHHVNAL